VNPTLLAPVDLAFARLFLMYQTDPAEALRKIAALVRPGGRIVAIDILPDRNYPAFDPPIPTAERIIRLFFALVQRIGGTVDVARTYQTLCEQAGLRLLGQRGWFGVARDPGNYVALYQEIFASMRISLVAMDLSTEEELRALRQEMDSARTQPVRFAASNLQVEMIADTC
jgi:SAM-dependent methyltransferase